MVTCIPAEAVASKGAWVQPLQSVFLFWADASATCTGTCFLAAAAASRYSIAIEGLPRLLYLGAACDCAALSNASVRCRGTYFLPEAVESNGVQPMRFVLLFRAAGFSRVHAPLLSF